MLDSEPEFFGRLADLKLDGFTEKFKQLGATTFAPFAFATTFAPGGDPDVFSRELLVPILGPDSDGNAAHKPHLRRLFTEAYTLASADLQRLSGLLEELKPTDRHRLQFCRWPNESIADASCDAV